MRRDNIRAILIHPEKQAVPMDDLRLCSILQGIIAPDIAGEGFVQEFTRICGDLIGKFVPYQHMASAIIFLTCKNGGCEPQDLLALGFSKEEAAKRWDTARAMANVEMRLMSDELFSNCNCETRCA
jgi:hypothetical protein